MLLKSNLKKNKFQFEADFKKKAADDEFYFADP
jgi:hypothetical protein